MTNLLLVVLVLLEAARLYLQLTAARLYARLKSDPVPPPPPPPVTPPPEVVSSPVAETLRHDGVDWQHHGFVREGTPAWQQVYDTPGYALRSRGELIEGVQ